MSDFISEEPVTIEIEGKQFKLKELTGTEYDTGMSEYLTVFEDGTYKVDLSKKNYYMLKKCIVDAPYKKGDLDFKDLTEEERFEILNKLKHTIRDKLLREINNMHKIDSDVTKN